MCSNVFKECVKRCRKKEGKRSAGEAVVLTVKGV